MTAPRPGVLRVGTRVRLDGAIHTVVGFSGTLVRLAGHEGQPGVIQLAALLASPGFEVVDKAGRQLRPLSAAAMPGVPQDAVEDALHWERHIIEVLTGLGEKVTARRVKRKRQRYQARGLAGLVDWRADRSRPVSGRTDERIVQALQKAIAEQESSSTRSGGYYMWRTRQILTDEYGPDVVPMPGRATFYRLCSSA